MRRPAAADKLEALGYTVDYSHPGTADAPATYYVEGHGVRTFVREDDEETWESLGDPEAHAERKQQDSETLEETMERLHGPDWAEPGGLQS